ncbi:MAG TPA: hypothetical protein VEH10_04390 [Thermoplasmata archaeon]|nr:hypothetical protein [Thermoplasmata archaeon]
MGSRAFDRFLPEIVAALLLAIAGGISIPLYFSHGDVTWAFAVIWGLATLASVALVPAVRRSGADWRKEVRLLFVVSAVIGVVSIVTGIGNNATDEPFTMQAYLGTLLGGKDPYTTSVTVSYTARTLNLWSQSVSAPFHYVYLPLLLFFQIPGTGVVGYKAVCLACWAGIVYVVRRDQVAALCLVSPVVALVAANGFTDLPVLLLMTLSLRGSTGLPKRAAEYVTYGMKQFANAFWLVYYIARRDAPRAALVIVVTLLLAAPFLLWHPTGIWCEALTFSLSPGCTSAQNSSRQLSDLYSHWNYYLWILWVYALYRVEIHRLVRRGWSRVRPHRAATGEAP